MTTSANPGPTFRRDLNMGNTWLLPDWSTGPVGDERTVLEAAVAAGYQGVQGANPELCRELGLVPVTFDIRIEPGGLAERARTWVDQGIACATLMVGTGFESDAEADRLAAEIVEASVAAGIPLYLETHRATMTQDMWRTLQLVERHPDLRFNGDFSHWYTGQDMAASDVGAKLDLLAPVIERVRYLHGRIASPGCVQVDVGDGRSDEAPREPLPRDLDEGLRRVPRRRRRRSGSCPRAGDRVRSRAAAGRVRLRPLRARPGRRTAGGGRPLGASPRAHPHRLRVLRRGGRRPLITTVRTSPEPPPIPHPLAHLVGDPATR